MASPSSTDPAPAQRSLGEVLVKANLISAQHLQQARQIQRKDARRLGEILIDNGWVTPQRLAMALSLQLDLPLIDLKRHAVQREALEKIPEETARKHNLIPLDVVDGALAVVMEDPTDIRTIEALTAYSGMSVLPMVGARDDIHASIDLNYRASEVIQREIADFVPSGESSEATGLPMPEESGGYDPVVRTVNLIVEQAYRDRASDIHIEPGRESLKVRYRIDGDLQQTLSLPMGSHLPLLSRIKVMAGMNLAERRRPQDGQFSMRVDGDEIFFRAASSDTTWGEMIVLRLLGRSDAILDLEGLGFLPDSLATFRRMVHSPFGIILVCGPTGSGKTTTLYAALNQLDRLHRNIITVEDPVEYDFPDINQIKVNRAAGIDFASGLRGIMRLDPDVIMVGEVRDVETARTAIQAALTGHLVLSSIHANDAAGALIRLIHLGVEHYLLTSAVVGVVAQRLVRTLCPHCQTNRQPTAAESAAFVEATEETIIAYKAGEGCNFCAGTGYLGRTGVFEVLPMSKGVRDLLSEGASSAVISAKAIELGMVPLRKDGMLKVRAGITTPGEVMRNVYTLGG
jgi:general secretion pathway protein E